MNRRQKIFQKNFILTYFALTLFSIASEILDKNDLGIIVIGSLFVALITVFTAKDNDDEKK